MKSWLLGSFSLLSSVLVASACVLVEDFQGYGPEQPCEEDICPNASSSGSTGSGMGGNGTSSSSGSGGSSSSSSGGGTTCPTIICSSKPCFGVEVVPDSQAGMLTMDSDSFFIATNTQPNSIIRVAKPGCSVPAFNQPDPTPNPDHAVVSDGKYAAWIVNDFSGATGCLSPALRFCDLTNCQPQDVVAATYFPDQGEFIHLELGPGHVFFTMRNGLTGRLAKGSAQPEMLWVDPEQTPQQRAFMGYMSAGTGKFFATRLWFGDYQSICASLATGTGALWASDPVPNAMPTKIANISFYGPLSDDDTYIYFHLKDGTVLMDRMTKIGGTIIPLNPTADIKAATELQRIVIKNGWVYFRAVNASGSQLIVRHPANSDTWSSDALEVMVNTPYLRSFAVDDTAIYWEECVDAVNCDKYHIMGKPLQ